MRQSNIQFDTPRHTCGILRQNALDAFHARAFWDRSMVAVLLLRATPAGVSADNLKQRAAQPPKSIPRYPTRHLRSINTTDHRTHWGKASKQRPQ